jgi:WD domain, G-beta repeat
MKDERAHLQLFDLIARHWTLPAPAQQVAFNADGSAVVFVGAEGGIHLAATADKDAPDKRIRRAVDTGRLTISPRDKAYAPLKPADFTDRRSSGVVACGPSGFAFAKTDGRINALTPGGIAVHLAARAASAITVLAAAPDGGTLAFACGAEVHLSDAAATDARNLPAPGIVRALEFSPDGTRLAVACDDHLSVWSLNAPDNSPVLTPLAGSPTGLTWHPDGTWLTVRMAADGFYLINIGRNLARFHGNFRAPVRNAAFGLTTNTVVASGAFRVAAWDLADGEAVLTGKPGLVLVSTVAPCPGRNLVAVGYANGLLSLAEIGQPSEILLRENTGSPVIALQWSPGGTHLALAGADGSAALVEFPDAMFKPSPQ